MGCFAWFRKPSFDISIEFICTGISVAGQDGTVFVIEKFVVLTIVEAFRGMVRPAEHSGPPETAADGGNRIRIKTGFITAVWKNESGFNLTGQGLMEDPCRDHFIENAVRSKHRQIVMASGMVADGAAVSAEFRQNFLPESGVRPSDVKCAFITVFLH